jgi:two-component system LytT family sensor kinase
MDLAPRTRAALIPVLCIQPLVENAIVHGMAPRKGRGTLTIRAVEREGDVAVSVADDGAGIAPDALERVLESGYGTGLGIGLNNVHQRLIGAFGPASGLRIESTLGAGTTVSFRVPAARPTA